MKYSSNTLQASILSVCRVLFVYVGLFVLTIMLSDAWNLIPSSVVLQRWTLASLILVVTAGVWYAARQTKSQALLHAYVWLLVIVNIGVAMVTVFAQRGMSSKAAMLYLVPLAVVAVLRSRVALMTTAILALASYSLAVMRYFVTSPGEGYKAELYTEILFYGGLFFIFAGLLYALVRPSK